MRVIALVLVLAMNSAWSSAANARSAMTVDESDINIENDLIDLMYQSSSRRAQQARREWASQAEAERLGAALEVSRIRGVPTSELRALEAELVDARRAVIEEISRADPDFARDMASYRDALSVVLTAPSPEAALVIFNRQGEAGRQRIQNIVYETAGIVDQEAPNQTVLMFRAVALILLQQSIPPGDQAITWTTEAARIFARLVELRPDDIEIPTLQFLAWMQVAHIELATTDVVGMRDAADNAVRALQTADMQRRDLRTYLEKLAEYELFLAEAYLNVGDRSEAILHLSRGGARNGELEQAFPNDPQVLRQLERLDELLRRYHATDGKQ
ncbi:hypothetical protein [uncultured Maricaulis sp.]|uniref:hypothetical protein n=1 Tax=uncultured Maricaulis sp. TaxID=174710 RepID=UPI0025EE54D9|nr:hypothetical protein [uncultured Maricaulis sp.]